MPETVSTSGYHDPPAPSVLHDLGYVVRGLTAAVTCVDGWGKVRSAVLNRSAAVRQGGTHRDQVCIDPGVVQAR
jgi:hypothetical protein